MGLSCLRPRVAVVKVMLSVLVSGSVGVRPALPTLAQAPKDLPAGATLSPRQYVLEALKSLRQHSALGKATDWNKVERDTLAASHDAQTPAQTYPALDAALHEIGDQHGFVQPPFETLSSRASLGMVVLMPERTVAIVSPGGAADKAGIRPGDTLNTYNGRPPEKGNDPRFAKSPRIGEVVKGKPVLYQINGKPMTAYSYRFQPYPVGVEWHHPGITPAWPRKKPLCGQTTMSSTPRPRAI